MLNGLTKFIVTTNEVFTFPLLILLDNVDGLMNTSAYPGQDVVWMCSVQSTSMLTFMWFINGVMVSTEMGTLTGQTVNSSYTLENINYTDSNSVVMCRAAGSSVTVESTNVTLTGNASLAISQFYAVDFLS